MNWSLREEELTYNLAQPIIFAERTKADLFSGELSFLPTNGHYIRSHRGRIFEKVGRGDRIVFLKMSPEGNVRGDITDTLLVHRIKEYFESYFENRKTNCSCFADFLYSGDFHECWIENRLLVARHHMRDYKKGQKVGIGDMVCLMYANVRSARSRRFDIRSKFLPVQKKRHDNGARLFISGITAKKVVSPVDLHEYHKSGFVNDFHFMVCVAMHKGQPVWLSQMGRKLSSQEHAPLVITIGDEDPCPQEELLLSFIARRK